MLSQLLILFGFFALILVGIFWINSAVRLFDQLIGDGQSAGTVLRYTILSLPRVVGTILPIAGFAAAIYVTNRLTGESELVVLQSSGLSPWRLARPVLVFGVMIACATAIIAHLLVPQARQELAERQRALTRDVAARLLTEGQFLHPTPGVTFYIREIGSDGTLNDVFLSDNRDSHRSEAFTARRAYLVNTAEDDETARPQLVMIAGMAQSLNHASGQLVTTRFDDFAYDLTQMIRDAGAPEHRAAYLPTGRLLSDPDAVTALTGESRGVVLEEAHGRTRDALISLATALIGFSALLLGTYNQFGPWRQISFAVLILVLVKMSDNLTAGWVRDQAELWPLTYLPAALALAIAAALLAWTARVHRRGAGADTDPGAVLA